MTHTPFSLLVLCALALSFFGCEAPGTAPTKGTDEHVIVLTGDTIPREKIAGDRASGDILVEASIGDASKLHSYFGQDASSHDITELIQLPLVEYNASWSLIPRAAKSYKVTQRSFFRFKPDSTVTPESIHKKWLENVSRYPRITGMGLEDNNQLLWVHFDFAGPDIQKQFPELIPDDQLLKRGEALFKLQGSFQPTKQPGASEVTGKIHAPFVAVASLCQRIMSGKGLPEGVEKVLPADFSAVAKEKIVERFKDAKDWFDSTPTARRGELLGCEFFAWEDFYLAFKRGLPKETIDEVERIIVKTGDARPIEPPADFKHPEGQVRFYRINHIPALKVVFNAIPLDAEQATESLFALTEEDKKIPGVEKIETLKGSLLAFTPTVEHNPWVEITMHPNIRFHDGVEWTTEDIAWNYRRLIDPEAETPYGGDSQEVKQFIIVDKYTFRAVYKRPFAPALEAWTHHFSVPKHLCNYPLNYNNPLYARKKGDGSIEEIPFHREPVGCGPFKFKQWVTDEKIVIERNPDFFDKEGIPNIREYVYRIVPDEATQLRELKAGYIDKMEIKPVQYLLHKDSLAIKRDYRIFRMMQNVYTYLGYNHLDPENLSKPNKFFGDRRVRLALAHAVDKRELVKLVVQGLGTGCTGPFSNASWAYNPLIQDIPYDLDKARQLLAEAGWTLGADGIREKVIDGKVVKFEFDLLTNQGNPQRKDCTVILQEAFKKIGVHLHPKILEWSIFLEKHVNIQNFDAIIIGWQLTPDPDCFPFFHSSQIGSKRFNFVGYKNPEVDELILKGRSLYDRAERTTVYHRIHQKIAEDQAYMFLYIPEEMIVLHNRFTNVNAAKLGLKFHYIDRWWVPKGQVKYAIR